MSSPTKARLPENNFDFLRFAFASLVVLSHSYPLGTGTEDFEPLALATRGQLTLGVLAVDCFFIISGFLIFHSWHVNPDLREYLKKRVLRIYPAFLIVAVLDAFLIAPAFSAGGYNAIDGGFFTRFVLNALRLQAVTPGPAFPGNPAAGPVNGSLWSISYEFWCYIGILVLGIAGFASTRKPLVWALLVSLLISFVFAWRHLTPGGRILGQIFGYPPFWARLLPFFLAGMVFYAYRDKLKPSSRGAAGALSALVVGALLPHGMTFILPLAAAYLIFWFAFLPIPKLPRFARYGDFSYGIYLYSFPILQIVVHFWGGPVPPLGLFVVGWSLSIALAVVSWHFLEKHCIRLGKTRMVRQAEPVGSST